MSNLLHVKNISKSYPLPGGGNLQIVEDLSFSIPHNSSGTIVSILAPFRAGKSTLLKILSSIETVSAGDIYLHEMRHNDIKSRIIYLPEMPASYPWLSVSNNIKMALKLNKRGKNLSLDEIITLIGLGGYEYYYPDNDSPGFRFRITLGRALALDPEIILIDDSFRHMDPITRGEMYELVKKVKITMATTIILATTNITEAVIVSDRILFMKKNPGRIFHDLNNINENKDDNYIELMRTEIEKIYKKENLMESLQFTI